MLLAGYDLGVILRVKNNTDKVIDIVEFSYNDNAHSTSIKKVK